MTDADRPPVALVVLSRHDDLLDLHLASHELYTPPGLPVVVVDTSDPGHDGVELVCAKDWLRPVVRVDARAGAPDAPARGRFYGNFCNLGVEKARTIGPPRDLLVLANDDTMVLPLWLDTMLEDFRELDSGKRGRCGLLGAKTNRVSGPQSVFDRTLLSHGVTGEMAFPYPRIVTFFAMVSLEAFRRSGGFDEDLPAWNFSDDILSVRLLQKGYTNWVSRAFVAHAGSETFTRAEEGDHGAYARDLETGKAYITEHYPTAGATLGAAWAEFYATNGARREEASAGATP